MGRWYNLWEYAEGYRGRGPLRTIAAVTHSPSCSHLTCTRNEGAPNCEQDAKQLVTHAFEIYPSCSHLEIATDLTVPFPLPSRR